MKKLNKLSVYKYFIFFEGMTKTLKSSLKPEKKFKVFRKNEKFFSGKLLKQRFLITEFAEIAEFEISSPKKINNINKTLKMENFY